MSFPIFAAMFSIMFHRICGQICLLHSGYSFYLNLSVNLTSQFSNFAEFRQLQIPNGQTKYYEILPAHYKIPHNTTRKIANWYFEFKYQFLTLQKNSD